MASLHDYMLAFFDGQDFDGSLNDRMYRWFQNAYDTGVNAQQLLDGLSNPQPVGRDTYRPSTRGGTAFGADPSRWTRHLLEADIVDAPASTLRFQHGQYLMEIQGGSGVETSRHEVWTPNDLLPAPYWRIKSRWASRPPADGIIQHLHAHCFQADATKHRTFLVWDGIFGSPSVGVWESNLDGSGFVSIGAVPIDREVVSAASRDGAGVVTLTVPTGAADRWKVGDAIVVNLTDNTYDGNFIITSFPAANQIRYTQQGGGVDADGGTGDIIMLGKEFTNFSTMTNAIYSATNVTRTAGVVTTTGVAAGHALQKGDYVVIAGVTDTTYNGRFVISNVNQTTNQVSWLQAAADAAASAGAPTITKNNPVWCESMNLPGDIMMARFWPDKGVDLNGGTPGPTFQSPPSWEQDNWTLVMDCSGLAGVTTPTGSGMPGLGAAHHSSASSVRYDSVEMQPLASIL